MISVLLILTTTYLTTTIHAAATVSNFSVPANSYNCFSNVICLGESHVYNQTTTNGIEPGMISLVSESLEFLQNSAGIVYYTEPIRLLDPSTQQAASFATSFKLDVRPRGLGTEDEMAFVISSDNSTLGAIGKYFGIFNSYNGATSFRSIVVESDGYQNSEAPCYDIDNNHVSFDFSNITTQNVTASAYAVNVLLWDNITIYAWVEYSWETQQLEVRVSYNESRPIDPLLKYEVDLFDVAEEYMWVGFSGGNSGGLASGIQVAVKKINTDSTQGGKEFLAEVSIINQARHKNLIQLRGWCRDASKKQYLLVYELMSNGSLDKWLFRPMEEETSTLSWLQRFNIVTGIAAAVEYLHHGCPRQVIHRDIKSSNIMLDKD
ncbi:unnamed protein product [Calypogeia fissa]